MSMVDDFLGNEHTTGRLAINGVVTGKLQRPYDEDWFAVTLTAGVTYYLTGSNPHGVAGFAIGIFDPVLDGVATGFGGGYDKELVLEFTPDRTGTYYAMATDWHGNFADTLYTLTIAPRSEPDDLRSDSGTAGVLTVGAASHGTMEQRGDVDWFKFRAEEGFHYSFTAGGAAGGVAGASITSVQVVDAYGRVVETPGWDGFNPVTSGDYYIAVVGASEGGYSVIATQVRDDFTEHQGTSGLLTAGNPVEGSIDYDRDQDWIRVDLEAGKYYTFNFQSVPDFVFSVRLQDSDGKRLDGISSYIRGDALQMTYKAETTGAAFLDISRSNVGSVDYATPYKISMTSSVDDIGQDAASASTLQFGASAHGSLQKGTDRDAFKISLSAGVSYRFDLSSGPGGEYLMLEVTGIDGGPALASRSVGTKGSLEFTPSSTGEYLVMAASLGGVTPNLAYSLSAEQAIDDWTANSAGAGRFGADGHAAGKLENTADRDWFAVSLEAGATYHIAAQSAQYGGALRLLDAAGLQLRNYEVPINGSPLSFKPDTTGTYYVEFSSRFQYTETYDITIKAGTPDDAGDTIATARPLTASGAQFDGHLEVGSDLDLYKLDVIEGQTYQVQVQRPTFSSIGLRMLDANGNALAGITPATANHGSNVVFVAQSTGPVYAAVRGYEASSYQIVSQVHHDDHPDTLSVAAPVLAEGASVSGVLEHGWDRDMLRMQLDAHRTYVVKIKSATPGNPPPAYELSPISSAHYPSVAQSLVDGERILTITSMQAGDYALAIKSFNFEPTSYTVTALPFAGGGDGIGPALIAQSHADRATGVSLTDRTITLKFSENIVIDRSAIVLRDSEGHAINASYIGELFPTVKGDTLVMKVQSHFTPGTYTLSLPASAIHDSAGNRYSGPESITFTTILPADAAGPGNDLYVSKPGTVIDGGDGVDTYRVAGASAFSFVLPYGDDFVVWNMLTGQKDTIRNIERLLFPDQVYALDVDGNAGQVYRLYQAAFNRSPDQGGLGFWIEHMDRGMSLQAVAQNFLNSPEFVSLYGTSQQDTAFVQALYQNVLHRAPDADGLAFWMDKLSSGASRSGALVGFSESPENTAALASIIGDGFPYLATWLG